MFYYGYHELNKIKGFENFPINLMSLKISVLVRSHIFSKNFFFVNSDS